MTGQAIDQWGIFRAGDGSAVIAGTLETGRVIRTSPLRTIKVSSRTAHTANSTYQLLEPNGTAAVAALKAVDGIDALNGLHLLSPPSAFTYDWNQHPGLGAGAAEAMEVLRYGDENADLMAQWMRRGRLEEIAYNILRGRRPADDDQHKPLLQHLVKCGFQTLPGGFSLIHFSPSWIHYSRAGIALGADRDGTNKFYITMTKRDRLRALTEHLPRLFGELAAVDQGAEMQVKHSGTLGRLAREVDTIVIHFRSSSAAPEIRAAVERSQIPRVPRHTLGRTDFGIDTVKHSDTQVVAGKVVSKISRPERFPQLHAAAKASDSETVAKHLSECLCQAVTERIWEVEAALGVPAYAEPRPAELLSVPSPDPSSPASPPPAP